MVYITGDTHGDFERIEQFCRKHNTTKDDVLIILGDAGINYYGDSRDDRKKIWISEMNITLFCVHGNHEMRPHDIDSYEAYPFCGGFVWREEKYPNILFAEDGFVYGIAGKSCIVCGGAYSVDKYYRLENGLNWFENEQPNRFTKNYVEFILGELGNKIDVILTHTCPFKYIPREMLLPGVDQSLVDQSTEKWLDGIEEKCDYSEWYCGHYHTNKRIDKTIFLYDDIVSFERYYDDN